MAQVAANGITLEYEVSGPAQGVPLLLIHGLGAQLVQWPEPLCAAFAAQGFRVIRFDNRDVGLSTHFDGMPIPNLHEVIAAQRRGEPPAIPYTIDDMADDALGLLSALGIERAHIFGVSMGGYIAQTIAIKSPARVRSLNLVMTHSANPDLPPPHPAAIDALLAVPPDPIKEEAAFLQHAVAMGRAIQGPGYPMDDAALKAFFLTPARRAFYPIGVGRHAAAAWGALDRREGLKRLTMPTTVIHGTDDVVVPLPGGEDVARHVPGAYLLTIKGMGHDLAPPLFDTFATAAAMNARRA
jgi:pimeloyl-ACP methyl ester carboxylesterase